MSDVTRILSQIEDGDGQAAEQLLPFVYDELRALAAVKLAQEKAGQTLQATALVHEAYIRLVDVERVQHWDSRGHFFAAAAEAMRRILVENARHKLALRHGGGWQRVELAEGDLLSDATPEQILSLNDALERLSGDDPKAAQLACLHIFSGLSIDQAAEILKLSRATAYRQWKYARARLRAEFRDL
jgi:RNA polymerase sigma factor (TIGR02999 family)